MKCCTIFFELPYLIMVNHFFNRFLVCGFKQQNKRHFIEVLESQNGLIFFTWLDINWTVSTCHTDTGDILSNLVPCIFTCIRTNVYFYMIFIYNQAKKHFEYDLGLVGLYKITFLALKYYMSSYFTIQYKEKYLLSAINDGFCNLSSPVRY